MIFGRGKSTGTGAAVLVALLLWLFAPHYWGQYQAARATSALMEMAHWPDEIDVTGRTVLYVSDSLTYVGGCDDLCEALLVHGNAAGLWVSAMGRRDLADPDWIALAQGEATAMIEVRETFVYVRGDPDGAVPPDSFDLVFLRHGLSTHRGTQWEIAGLPSSADPSDGLFVFARAPDGSYSERARLISAYVDVPAMFFPLSVDAMPAPSPAFYHSIVDGWFCPKDVDDHDIPCRYLY